MFIILLSECLLTNVDDSRGEKKNHKSARHPDPALHAAGLPHSQHRAVARLQEEHQSFRAKLFDWDVEVRSLVSLSRTAGQR